MGYIEVELSEHIKKAIENLAKNQTTEIVEAPDAFEIFKLTDKHSGGILSFELAERYVFDRLMQAAAPPKIRDFLNRLREDGFVEVKEGFTDEGAVKPKVKTASTNP
jgi:parvulin-like peptidyl-prolyl isomerase